MSDKSSHENVDTDDVEDIRAKLVRGILMFYLANFLGLFFGLICIRAVGNFEGVAIMLFSIFVLYLSGTFLVIE